ncbi:MAG: methyltransferase domain-containing protein [Candidatus Omnitrophica bacterium]|nr:methyltransferase domain-containing protein [Candidatus Omnitrophota bacterium]
MVDKERVSASFSKAALTYDKAADFQKETGRRLIEMVLSDAGSRETVLDSGMGTGSVTERLAGLLGNGSRVYGCDLAWGMVSFSKKVRPGICVCQADAEGLPYRDCVFDIVFSNIAYQWVSDFRLAFLELKRVLKPGGRFYFSILSRESLRELDTALKITVGGPGVKNFLPTTEDIRSELRRSGLRIEMCGEEIFKRYYKSSMDLIKIMKEAGSNTPLGPSPFGMGKRRKFLYLLSTYDRMFNESGRVFATYKVVMGCAKKI